MDNIIHGSTAKSSSGGHSKAFKNGILSELPRFAREMGKAAWTDNQSGCNPPSENPGYGPEVAIGPAGSLLGLELGLGLA